MEENRSVLLGSFRGDTVLIILSGYCSRPFVASYAVLRMLCVGVLI
jgi:hypothetical protein